MELGSDGLIKATHQLQIRSHSPAPASNTIKDLKAAVQGALPRSMTPVIPHPGLSLPHRTPEPSPPMRDSDPSSSPALAQYPESTLPLPPLLKARRTPRHRRRTPAHISLHSSLLGQAGADELFSLARQYGACIDQCQPKHPKQELSAQKSDNVR